MTTYTDEEDARKRITLALHNRNHSDEETEAIESLKDRAYSQFVKALRRVAEQAENSGTPIRDVQEVS